MIPLRILYAASNNQNAKIQLSRFQQALIGSPHIVKIAAYKQSSPNTNIDWTLDCLLNVFNPNHISLENDNFDNYFQQIKYYNPDLIISDLEYFTSYIANVLDITLWQCSSSVINFALTTDYKYDLGVFKRYAYIFNRNPVYIQRLVNILDNSNCNYVYSHLGDTLTPPILKPEYQWIRPYTSIGKKSIPCQHQIVSGTLNSNKKIISLLRKYTDCVSFMELPQEKYDNPHIKNLNNQEEYICNLFNSQLFVCEGQTSFLADAFYNQKYSIVLTNIEDTECLINSTVSEKLGLSTSLYHVSDDVQCYMNLPVTPNKNSHIKMLHEKLEDL